MVSLEWRVNEQHTKAVEMIKVDVDDTEADDTVSTPFGWRMEYSLSERR